MLTLLPYEFSGQFKEVGRNSMGKISTLPRRFEILLYYQWSKSANSSTILIFPPPRELENSFPEENVWIQRCYQCNVIGISHKMRLKLNINLQCYSDLHPIYTTHQFGICIKGIYFLKSTLLSKKGARFWWLTTATRFLFLLCWQTKIRSWVES